MLTQSVAKEYLSLARANALYTQLYFAFSNGNNTPQKEVLVSTQLKVWSDDTSDTTKKITQHMAAVAVHGDFTTQIIAFEESCKTGDEGAVNALPLP